LGLSVGDKQGTKRNPVVHQTKPNQS